MHFFPYVRACVCVCVRVCETREGYGPYCSIELLNKCVCVCVRERETREGYGPDYSIELLNERMHKLCTIVCKCWRGGGGGGQLFSSS